MLGSVQDLRKLLASSYKKQIDNYFGGDERRSLKFLSAVVSSAQRIPKLMECTPDSVINSFMIMAQFELMPSDVSGEAYVLPYKKGENLYIAQFQLGYQGIVTLLYRAGAKEVVAELVRKNDGFKIVNGKVSHEVDPFKTTKERGEVIGAYAIISLGTGGTVERFMRIEDIKDFGKKFSKSYGTKFSPWEESNDPEGWMIRKTVLKQASKLAPKNDALMRAFAEDNKDSIINDRVNKASEQSSSLKMGAILKDADKENSQGEESENEVKETSEDH